MVAPKINKIILADHSKINANFIGGNESTTMVGGIEMPTNIGNPYPTVITYPVLNPNKL